MIADGLVGDDAHLDRGSGATFIFRMGDFNFCYSTMMALGHDRGEVHGHGLVKEPPHPPAVCRALKLYTMPVFDSTARYARSFSYGSITHTPTFCGRLPRQVVQAHRPPQQRPCDDARQPGGQSRYARMATAGQGVTESSLHF